MRNFCLLVILALATGYTCSAQVLNLTFTASNTHTCTGTTIVLRANVTGSQPPYLYRWESPDTIATTNEDTFVVTPGVTTKYFVTVRNSSGDSVVASLTVTVDQFMSIRADKDTICAGDLVTFTALPEGYPTYNFYNGSSLQQSSTSNKWLTQQLNDGNHISVIVPGNFCFQGSSSIDSVFVKPTPQIAINNPVDTFCPGTPVPVMLLSLQLPSDSFSLWVNSKLIETNTTGSFICYDHHYGDTLTGTGYYNNCISEHSSPLILDNCEGQGKVEGLIFLDQFPDCNRQNTEPVLRYIKVNLYDAGKLVASGYFGNGLYYFNVPFGNYRIELDTTGLPFVFSCFIDSAVEVNFNHPLVSVNFGIQCKPGFDLEAFYLSNGFTFRPGRGGTLCVNAGNAYQRYGVVCTGSQKTGLVKLVLDKGIKYISPSPGALTPTFVSGDTVEWQVTNFDSITNGSFYIEIAIDSSIPIGTLVCMDLSITPTEGDYDPSNNFTHHCLNIRNSYDPNEKNVSPSGNTDVSIKWLTYTVRFQNTGTDTAFTVSILDTLNQHVDWSTFQLLTSSHETNIQIFEGGIVKFTFPNINLPDSSVNEPLSHGYVQYKVKLKSNLVKGTTIPNTAYISFDLNDPVATNTTLNIISLGTGISALYPETPELKIFPNPTTGLLNITAEGILPDRITIYDLNGRTLREQKFVPQLDISALNNGIYFIEVKDGNAVARTRFVKM